MPASRSRPKPSVAKLRLQSGRRKVVKTEKTSQLENTKKPLASAITVRQDAQTAWWTARVAGSVGK